MEEIYVNVLSVNKPVDPRPSTNQTAPSSSERRFVLCLGLLSLLLLAGLIGLGVHHADSARSLAADLSTIKANLTARDDELTSLTEELNRIQSLNKQYADSARSLTADLSTIKANLTARDDELTSLTEERDLLNASLTKMTEELNRIQSLNKQKRTCPEGWLMSSDSCYFLSDKSASWDESRKYCRERGADLLVINSLDEQRSLLALNRMEYWIGLNDRDKEGTWKWIDGTPLTLTKWLKKQPDNGGGDPHWGEEDCVHILTSTEWNDRSCQTSLPWICEKTA